jgi:hypothetical protein
MQTVDPRLVRPVSAEVTYSGSWLAIKLGLEPRELDRLRRAGEYVAVRASGGRETDYLYPAWQLDAAGRPLPGVAELVRAARERGLDDEQLVSLMLRREGLTGSSRLADAFRAGHRERVLAAVRAG